MPLLIHVPQLNTESVIIHNLVELVDLFPTLVDLTQVSDSLETCEGDQTELCTEGKSLVPLMYSSAKQEVIHF